MKLIRLKRMTLNGNLGSLVNKVAMKLHMKRMAEECTDKLIG